MYFWPTYVYNGHKFNKPKYRIMVFGKPQLRQQEKRIGQNYKY
jgi:hypothetical protein